MIPVRVAQREQKESFSHGQDKHLPEAREKAKHRITESRIQVGHCLFRWSSYFLSCVAQSEVTGKPAGKGQGGLAMLPDPLAGLCKGMPLPHPSLAVHGACPVISKAKPLPTVAYPETEAQRRASNGPALE